MEAIPISIAAKISEYLVAPIGRQLSYLFQLSGNVKTLQKESEKLLKLKGDVQFQVGVATDNVEYILATVENWLEDVGKALGEAQTIIDDKARFPKGCLNGWFLNIKSLHGLSKKAKKRTQDIVELQQEAKFPKVSLPAPPVLYIGSTSTTYDSRELILNKIIKSLKDENINMIGICGMGGVGKTIMADEVLKRVKEENMFDDYAKTIVSQMVDIIKMQRDIVKGLSLEIKENNQDETASRLTQRLEGKKVLIILDDVWEEFDLEALGITLQGGQNRCKIIFTSRTRGLWMVLQSRRQELLLHELSYGEAWNLFKEKVGNILDEQPEFVPLAEDIVKECGGLPLVVVALGCALRGQSKHAWKDTRDRVKTTLGLESRTLESLKLSYDHLDSDEAKSVFLLCSLFEENSRIYIESLVDMGMGLRLFKRINSVEAARDRVFALVEHLHSRCLVSKGEAFITVHDVVRDVSKSIASTQKGSLVLEQGVTTEMSLDKILLEHCTWISIISNEIKELPSQLQFPRLELLRCSNNCLRGIPDSYFEGMAKLQVLDINLSIDSMYHRTVLKLPSSLQSLTNLHTLCLQNFCVEDFTAIKYLKNLEILRITDKFIEELPNEIGQLTKLRLLDMSDCRSLKRISPGIISGLTVLEELYLEGLDVDWGSKENEEGRIAAHMEFESMANLYILHIVIKDPSFVPLFKNLKKYKIQIGVVDYFTTEPDFNYAFQKYERTLSISGVALEIDFDFILHNSEALLLKGKSTKSLVYELVQKASQSIKFLLISETDTPEYLANVMDPTKVPFLVSTLESLTLKFLDNLQQIINGPLVPGNFAKLKKLVVGRCKQLRNIFRLSNTVDVLHLEYLWVLDCESMEEVICWERREEEANLQFPNLKELTIGGKSLISFCEGANEIEFHQLECMTLLYIPAVECIVSNSDENSIFPLKVLFPRLVEIKLCFMPNVKEIWCGQPQAGSFCNLAQLYVGGCDNLQYVFSPCMARYLVHLQRLSIADCRSLKEVVAAERDKDVEEEYSISILPKLKSVWLHGLAALGRFCHIANDLVFPELDDVYVVGCPEFKTFAPGFVHTPILHYVKLEYGTKTLWKGNLNNTVQHLYEYKKKKKRKEKEEEEGEEKKGGEREEVEEERKRGEEEEQRVIRTKSRTVLFEVKELNLLVVHRKDFEKKKEKKENEKREKKKKEKEIEEVEEKPMIYSFKEKEKEEGQREGEGEKHRVIRTEPRIDSFEVEELDLLGAHRKDFEHLQEALPTQNPFSSKASSSKSGTIQPADSDDQEAPPTQNPVSNTMASSSKSYEIQSADSNDHVALPTQNPVSNVMLSSSRSYEIQPADDSYDFEKKKKKENEKEEEEKREKKKKEIEEVEVEVEEEPRVRIHSLEVEEHDLPGAHRNDFEVLFPTSFNSRELMLKVIIQNLKDKKINMVGICGVRGVGKTTMVEEVFKRVMEENMFDEYAKTVVSQKPDMIKVQKDIAERLGLRLGENKPHLKAGWLNQSLKGKKVLIILDDVWEEFDLQSLGITLEGGQRRCKIVFTSRTEGLWREFESRRRELLLKELLYSGALNLFKEKVGKILDEKPEFVPIAEDVVKECKGLPLAVVALGCALRGQTKHAWNDTLEKLRTISVEPKVYKSLRLSYDHLGDDEAKSVFLLCSLFEEDSCIYIESLVNMGMGLRLFKGINSVEEARDRVFTLVEHLQSRCLVSKKEAFITVHDVVRDVSKSITFTDEKGSLQFPRLELLRCRNEDPQIPGSYFKEMGKLQVIDIICSSRQIDISLDAVLNFPSSLQSLTSLHTLCLRYFRLGDFSAIKLLQSLEIVRIADKYIEELPKEIGELTKLRLLDMSDCEKLKKVSPGVISGLKNLEELYLGGLDINWGTEENEEDRSATLCEFKSLSSLRILHIMIKDQRMLPNIPIFENLKKHRIQVGLMESHEFQDSENYERILSISHVALGEDFKFLLHNSEALLLKGESTNSLLCDLDRVGSQSIKCLEIWETDTPVYLANVMDDKKAPFLVSSLESLRLIRVNNLLEIINVPLVVGNFAKLKKLEVYDCKHLTNIFRLSNVVDVLHLELEKLFVYDCESMEEIICWKGREEEANRKLQFPKLRDLRIGGKSLVCFCKGANEILFDELEKLSFGSIPAVKCITSISHENPLNSIFPTKVLFPKLVEMNLKFMQNVEEIWCGQPQVGSFLNLGRLIIYKCDSLKYVFSPSMAGYLAHLHTLEICHCQSLKEIVNGSVVVGSLVKLKELKVIECNQLRNIFQLSTAVDIVHLETLEIECCESMEEVIKWGRGGEYATSKLRFPELQRLRIRDSSLTCFCKGAKEIEFHQLESLYLGNIPAVECLISTSNENILKSIFPHKVSFLQLQEMTLYRLENMKEIWCGELQSGSFKNLSELDIGECDSLEYVFSPRTAKYLAYLRRLKIFACMKLKEVIPAKNDGRKEHTSIIFPQLEAVKLYKLRAFRIFSHIANDLEFPVLDYLGIVDCPKFKNFSPGTMHSPNLKEVKLYEEYYWPYRDIIYEPKEEEKECLWKGNLKSTIIYLHQYHQHQRRR